ncbi:carbohydrate-binding module family 1 protein [Oidiodendron maius Zn]|uniref:Carbohydrate-binding module family 1 protein n=1 Tax=Oidiodendron maius (strain Zn) TaxID=913774 RepID=A0A0C3GPY0_OIDMZ|nr:carbohydrate-binding module family 1 protein [Oidiodendron maius Zn]
MLSLPTILTSLGLLASAAWAAPHTLSARQSASGLNVVYWGQNGGGTVENNNLAAYCASNSGIDVIVLAFLYEYGNGNNIPSGTIGQSCFISTSGEGQNCDNVISSIATCQAAGIKVVLSLGGASGSYSLQSQAEAETIGQYLWDAYGGSTSTSVQRPLGSTVVDGWDFDIEVNEGSQYYQYLIATLRSNFASDSSRKFVITGAPQCPIPEPNMGVIVSSSQFDYLWVQFYNNNNGLDNNTYESCSLGFGDNAPLNYNQWVSFIAGTPSKNAKIFFGVPAAPLAANGSPSGETYYITPDQLAELVEEYKSNSAFGGVMMWSAGFSDTNVNNGCTYAQEAHSILSTGAPCGESGPPPPTTTTTTSVSSPTSTSSATSSAPTSTATGTVPQWGQCGGEGYTGSTQCQSPYTCVETSVWWSQCE